MHSIKFKSRLKKMPAGIEYLDTFINDVSVTDYRLLSYEEIRKETQTVNGSFLTLPHTSLIWVKLWTVTLFGGSEWSTMRRFTDQKFKYYCKLLGQQVKIEIED